MIKFLILVSKQGKIRLTKWYAPLPLKDRQRVIKEVVPLVLARKGKVCNFVEYRDNKVVYKRYASLYFVAGVDQQENELLCLEIIHR